MRQAPSFTYALPVQPVSHGRPAMGRGVPLAHPFKSLFTSKNKTPSCDEVSFLEGQEGLASLSASPRLRL